MEGTCGFRNMSRLQPTTKEFLASSDEIVEKEFFERVFLHNRSVKTTYARRLDDLNQVAFRHIADIKETPVKIMDVAMSSGISTVEWRDQLAANRVNFDLTGTDLTIDAVLHSYAKFGLLSGTFTPSRCWIRPRLYVAIARVEGYQRSHR